MSKYINSPAVRKIAAQQQEDRGYQSAAGLAGGRVPFVAVRAALASRGLKIDPERAPSLAALKARWLGLWRNSSLLIAVVTKDGSQEFRRVYARLGQPVEVANVSRMDALKALERGRQAMAKRLSGIKRAQAA